MKLIKKIILFTVLAFILAVTALELIAGNSVRQLALEQVRGLNIEVLSDAINTEISRWNCPELTKLESDVSGNSFLFISTSELNSEVSKICTTAQRLINESGDVGTMVSVGNLIPLISLSGKGGKIKVNFSTVSSVRPKLKSNFISQGVNQTKLEIILTLSCSTKFVLAGEMQTVNFSHTAILYETVIVGSVPNAFTNIDSVEDALNLLPEDE